MVDDKEHFFTITDNLGNTMEYEILFTFDSDETKKNYIIFTDNKVAQDGSIITYAATYVKDGEKIFLNDIETDTEWDLVENILAQIEDKIEE